MKLPGKYQVARYIVSEQQSKPDVNISSCRLEAGAQQVVNAGSITTLGEKNNIPDPGKIRRCLVCFSAYHVVRTCNVLHKYKTAFRYATKRNSSYADENLTWSENNARQKLMTSADNVASLKRLKNIKNRLRWRRNGRGKNAKLCCLTDKAPVLVNQYVQTLPVVPIVCDTVKHEIDVSKREILNVNCPKSVQTQPLGAIRVVSSLSSLVCEVESEQPQSNENCDSASADVVSCCKQLERVNAQNVVRQEKQPRNYFLPALPPLLPYSTLYGRFLPKPSVFERKTENNLCTDSNNPVILKVPCLQNVKPTLTSVDSTVLDMEKCDEQSGDPEEDVLPEVECVRSNSVEVKPQRARNSKPCAQSEPTESGDSDWEDVLPKTKKPTKMRKPDMWSSIKRAARVRKAYMHVPWEEGDLNIWPS